MKSPDTKPPKLPKTIWAIGFVSLLMDVSSELIHSLLPLFMVSALGVSALTVGIIEGVAAAIATSLKVFSGALSDYWGKRKGLTVLGYGLSAIVKPLFALATAIEPIVAARFFDRVGKGIRGAPRDALIADITPVEIRGAAYGLRKSLDSTGAFIGPLLAIGLMMLWANDFRAVFWFATLPALLAMILLIFVVKEPQQSTPTAKTTNPIKRANLAKLSKGYWLVVLLGASCTLARFSEAFLLLKAEQGGLMMAWVPLVLVVMNLIYALCAYPIGRLADRISHRALFAAGMLVLVIADVILALGQDWTLVLVGVGFWGLHMGMTQGLLATMVADQADESLRGTAFGIFNLVSSVCLLFASAIAGLLWDQLGSSATFICGATFSSLALLLILTIKTPQKA